MSMRGRVSSAVFLVLGLGSTLGDMSEKVTLSWTRRKFTSRPSSLGQEKRISTTDFSNTELSKLEILLYYSY